MKSLLSIFAILFVALLVILIIFSLQPRKNALDFEEIVWRLPKTTEKEEIENAFFLNRTLNCKDFYIKKLQNFEYLVACSENDKWRYYNVITSKKEVITPNPEAIAQITAPLIKENKSPKEKKADPSSKSSPSIKLEAK